VNSRTLAVLDLAKDVKSILIVAGNNLRASGLVK
jgi:hypothetical protein